jgi:hypothetical protein
LHELKGGLPGVFSLETALLVDGYRRVNAREQVEHASKSFSDIRRRVCKSLKHLEILKLETFEGSLSFGDKGQGSIKIFLDGGHLRGNSTGDNLALFGLNVGDCGLGINLFLFGTDNGGLFISDLLDGLDFNGGNKEVFFELGNDFLGVIKLDHTDFVSVLGVDELVHGLGEHVLEEFNQLKERLGSGVNESSLLVEDIFRLNVNSPEREGHELNDSVTNFLRHLKVLKELGCHRKQRLLGPGVEPINNCCVNKGGELASTGSESITNGRETERHVEVLLHTVNEELPAVVLVVNEALGLNGWAHGVDNTINVFGEEEVGDLTGGKQIVDEHKEAFVGDLAFSEEEANTFVLGSRLHEHLLEINLQLVDSVGGGDHNADGRGASDEGGETREGLLTRTTDTDEKGVA